jgi:hypothetical protein
MTGAAPPCLTFCNCAPFAFARAAAPSRTRRRCPARATYGRVLHDPACGPPGAQEGRWMACRSPPLPLSPFPQQARPHTGKKSASPCILPPTPRRRCPLHPLPSPCDAAAGSMSAAVPLEGRKSLTFLRSRRPPPTAARSEGKGGEAGTGATRSPKGEHGEDPPLAGASTPVCCRCRFGSALPCPAGLSTGRAGQLPEESIGRVYRFVHQSARDSLRVAHQSARDSLHQSARG